MENEKRGKEILLLYLKLLLAALETDGRLRYDEKRPLTPAQLAVVTQTPPMLINRALELLQDFGFIQWEEDGTLYLPKLQEMVGCEGDSAVRMRRSRENRASHCDTGVTNCYADVTQSKSIEKEIEIEKESDQELEEEMSSGEVFFRQAPQFMNAPPDFQVKLTLDQHRLLRERMGIDRVAHYLEKMDEFTVRKQQKIRDPVATILKWYEEDTFKPL